MFVAGEAGDGLMVPGEWVHFVEFNVLLKKCRIWPVESFRPTPKIRPNLENVSCDRGGGWSLDIGKSLDMGGGGARTKTRDQHKKEKQPRSGSKIVEELRIILASASN